MPRKRVKTESLSEDSKDEQKQLEEKRREQNWIFAKRSRDKKRQYIEDLEQKCINLENENKRLKAKVRSLEKIANNESPVIPIPKANENIPDHERDFFGPGSDSLTTMLEKSDEEETMIDSIRNAIEKFSLTWGPHRESIVDTWWKFRKFINDLIPKYVLLMLYLADKPMNSATVTYTDIMR